MHEQNDLQSVSESGGKPPFLQTGEQLLLQLHLRIGIYEINRRFHEVTAPGWINTVAHTTGSGSGVSKILESESMGWYAGGDRTSCCGGPGYTTPQKIFSISFFKFLVKILYFGSF